MGWFSFEKRRQVVDIAPYLRRLCDLTTPNALHPSAEGGGKRSEQRYNRCLPALLCPWTEDGPNADACSIVLTRDFCDRGIGLVSPENVQADQVVVGFWVPSDSMPEPWFFLGRLTRSVPIGGRFWSLGVEFHALANAEHPEKLDGLRELASSLLQPQTVDTC
ncbi:MAG: hypothetical protein HYS13_25130 [Planctomycetia bacterium]|nr:hypothetical protein [Planctomycetia bacterium]